MKVERELLGGLLGVFVLTAVASFAIGPGDVTVETEGGCFVHGPWIDGNRTRWTPWGTTIRVPPGEGRWAVARVDGKWRKVRVDVPPGRSVLRVGCREPWLTCQPKR